MKFFLLLLLLVVETAFGATRYVRPNGGSYGSENGTDWTNAYDGAAGITINAGDTIYVGGASGGGNYTAGFPSITSKANVTIKRATIADHGTSTGWVDTMDSDVTFTNVKVFDTNATDNLTIDGGGTKEPWKFHIVGQTEFNGMCEFDGGTGVTIRYIDFNGNGCQPDEVNGPEDGIRFYGMTSLVFEHNKVHDYWYCTGSGNVGHSDGIQMPDCVSAIFRYNWFQDCGMLLFIGDCAWTGYANNVHIHHNVFVQRSGTLGANEANYRFQDHKGINQTSSSHYINENNTYYRASGFDGATLYENGDCPGNTTRRVVRNNLYIGDADVSLSSGLGTTTKNWFQALGSFGSNTLSGDPGCVNASGLNFNLTSGSTARGAGANTALGYGDTLTVDYNGTAIGSPPSVGAFEYASGAPAAAATFSGSGASSFTRSGATTFQ